MKILRNVVEPLLCPRRTATAVLYVYPRARFTIQPALLLLVLLLYSSSINSCGVYRKYGWKVKGRSLTRGLLVPFAPFPAVIEKVVSMKTGGAFTWSEVGRTEVVANNLNPTFVTLIPAVSPPPPPRLAHAKNGTPSKLLLLQNTRKKVPGT